MTEKEIVTGFFEEGYAKKNYDFVLEYVSENYIDHSPAKAGGSKGAVQVLEAVAEQFSKMDVTILDIFAENEMVAARVLYECIHRGMCVGISATEKRIRFEALENFKVVDGKIVESWGYWPDKEIERQLLD